MTFIKNILLLVLLFLTACSTTYHKSDNKGFGYFDAKLPGNMFIVSFRGNDHTSLEDLKEMFLLRCAEVTVKNGYKYFQILEKKGLRYEAIKTDDLTAEGVAFNIKALLFTGELFAESNSGNNQKLALFPPESNKRLLCYKVICYKDRPEDIPFLNNARDLKDELWLKYHMRYDDGDELFVEAEEDEPSDNKITRHAIVKPLKQINVAIAEFKGEEVSQADASAVTCFLRTELVKTKYFKVVDKKNMDKILAEVAFQQTGCTDTKCAVKMGRILNVKRMIVGSVSKFMGAYVVKAELIDVETEEVIGSEQAGAGSVRELDYACLVLADKLIMTSDKKKVTDPEVAEAVPAIVKYPDSINMAVAEFEGNNVSQADASTAANFLRTELVKDGHFKIVEREEMDKILSEAAFQQTGCTDSSCAVKMGKLLNVQQMILGSVSYIMGSYVINVNIVDIETGQVLNSEKVTTGSLKKLELACVDLVVRITELQK
jgi:curli biogenesis system outer membrane secretion channel CsgG